MRTDPIAIDGVEKKTWWKVDLGRISNLYSITILFRNYDGYGMGYFIKIMFMNLHINVLLNFLNVITYCFSVSF